MIDRESFLNELNNMNLDRDLHQKLITIFNMYETSENDSNLADDVLKLLFKGRFSEFCVPVSFINSIVGEVIFTVKFNKKVNIFTPIEVSTIALNVKSMITYDIENNKLKAYRHTGLILITEDNLRKYLSVKGISEEEISQRIKLFLKLKSDKVPNTEIKKQIKNLSLNFNQEI